MSVDTTWSQAVRRSFGTRVRTIRSSASLSQEELALRCGLDRSYVGQVERGERNISLENIYRIAEGLCVPPGTLLGALDGALDLDSQEGSK